jgi:hypothetical protein
MTRADMVRAFQTAFDEWVRRHELRPMKEDPSGRGAYFAELLDEVAGQGMPWGAIGLEEPSRA